MSEMYLGNAIGWCLCTNTRCPDPYAANWEMAPAYADVFYRWLFQIPGAGPYSFQLIDKPEWLNVYFDQVTGRIRVEGLPTEDEVGQTIEITFAVANCGRALDEDGITVNFAVLESEFQMLVDFDLSDIIDFDGQPIDTN